MNHKGTKRIETKRLILRPFRMEDAEPMYRNWASDQEVTRYLTWNAHTSVEDTKQILTSWTESYSGPANYQWAIELKETGEPIGSIAAVEMNENTCRKPSVQSYPFSLKKLVRGALMPVMILGIPIQGRSCKNAA